MASISRGTFLKAATASVAAIALAGCSTGSKGDSSSTSSAGSTAEANAFPVKIDHAFGTTEIKEEPKKVVGIGWLNAEMALSVGVVAAGAATVDWGENSNHSTDWYDAKAKELGGETKRYSEKDGINFTEIAKIQPDLILAVVGTVSQSDYDKLSKIAPTVAPKKDTDGWSTPWQENTKTIAKALGREKTADQLIEDVRKQMEEAASKHPQIKDKTFVSSSLSITDGQPEIAVYTNGDGRVVFFKELGMKEAEAVTAKNNKTFYFPWPNEKASDLKSDFLYSWVTKESDVAAVKNDKVLKQIPAVAKDAVFLDPNMSDTVALNTGLGYTWLLEKTDFVQKVADAVDKSSK